MSARTTVMVLARAVISSSDQSHWLFSSAKRGLFQQAGSLSCVIGSCSSNADRLCFMIKVSRHVLATATPLLAKAHHFLLGSFVNEIAEIFGDHPLPWYVAFFLEFFWDLEFGVWNFLITIRYANLRVRLRKVRTAV